MDERVIPIAAKLLQYIKSNPHGVVASGMGGFWLKLGEETTEDLRREVRLYLEDGKFINKASGPYWVISSINLEERGREAMRMGGLEAYLQAEATKRALETKALKSTAEGTPWERRSNRINLILTGINLILTAASIWFSVHKPADTDRADEAKQAIDQHKQSVDIHAPVEADTIAPESSKQVR